MNLFKHQSVTGVICILAGLLAAACMFAGLYAVNFDTEVLADPLLMLTTEAVNTDAVRWSMVLDMFGYYLLLLPVIFMMHDWIKKQTPWAGLISFSGLAYVLIGAIGAAILAVIWPNMLEAYPSAEPERQPILAASFSFANDMVYGGMWNLLELLLAGLWWIWTGLLLIRHQFKWIGAISIITGSCSMADSIAGIFQVPSLHELALNLYLVFSIIWSLSMGFFLLRKPLKPAE